MQGANAPEASGSASASSEALKKEALAIEDWVSQESVLMPKDTNGSLIQELDAALQLLQLVSDKVGRPE